MAAGDGNARFGDAEMSTGSAVFGFETEFKYTGKPGTNFIKTRLEGRKSAENADLCGRERRKLGFLRHAAASFLT